MKKKDKKKEKRKKKKKAKKHLKKTAPKIVIEDFEDADFPYRTYFNYHPFDLMIV